MLLAIPIERNISKRAHHLPGDDAMSEVMAGETANTRTVVRGIVIPVARNRKHQVTNVAVSSADREEYVIDLNDTGRKLLKLVNEIVRVAGLVRREKDGKMKMTVEEYTLIS
jgi:hypothetical protein